MPSGPPDIDLRKRPQGPGDPRAKTSSRWQTGGTTAAAGSRPLGPHRRLLTTVAVVVLLIAGIALANRGRTSDDSAAAAVDPLAVEIPHSRQGAQSAAAKMAAALGAERMFNPDRRHDVVQMLVIPEKRNAVRAAIDADGCPAVLTACPTRPSYWAVSCPLVSELGFRGRHRPQADAQRVAPAYGHSLLKWRLRRERPVASKRLSTLAGEFYPPR
ncbi:hypothetical protein [Streptomyces olivochromogenes]|uniref:hypothetical protein n=1 Tax=Streptomyces olivochromogenes TaxID=1963 RepID=UPI001F1709C7|nr:hypothetical protein [Streptomyces olivochromogenes]MCF3136834.1 hypothetical protein [Streptomyces olivochromogenes]